MKTLILHNLFVFSLFLSALFVPHFVLAQGYEMPENTFLLADGFDGGSVADILIGITNFLAGLLAPLTILMIVIAGIIFMVSGGREGPVGVAKSILTYAIVGFIIALLAYVIVLTVSDMLGVESSL